MRPHLKSPLLSSESVFKLVLPCRNHSKCSGEQLLPCPIDETTVMWDQCVLKSSNINELQDTETKPKTKFSLPGSSNASSGGDIDGSGATTPEEEPQTSGICTNCDYVTIWAALTTEPDCGELLPDTVQ